MTELFMFNRPETQLPAYWKSKCQDLRKFNFCLIEDEAIRGISKPNVDVAAILQLFQEACRHISNEKDQELIIDQHAKPPDMLIALAPKGHTGTLPETYVEDADGKGVHEEGVALVPDPEGEQLEIDAKFDT